MIDEIRLLDVDRGRRQLAFRFGADALRFHTTYWYGDVDLVALEERYGVEAMRRVYAHIAAFELNKLVSLAPRRASLGPLGKYVTAELSALWATVVRHIWGQWRYENDRPDYVAPRLPVGGKAGAPIEHAVGEVEALAFCGGGKDSLLSLRLLEQAGVPFASQAYAVSIYGPSARQHALIDGLLDHCKPARRHRMWVFDDFLDSPVLDEIEGVSTVTAAETPSSIMATLPVALAHGYRWLVLGHEASANVGNLVWDETGEEINHQWGKSLEAQELIGGYLRSALVADVRYVSALQPVHDPVIFGALNGVLDGLAATHSCSVAKPWCERCPKCAYVYLGYMAYLPVEQVASIFGSNLFDTPENVEAYRLMLGLGDHTPFECIGQIDEVRLAFELCVRKGVGGAAVELYRAAFPELDWRSIVDRHCGVEGGLPGPLAAVVPLLEGAAKRTRAQIVATLEAV